MKILIIFILLQINILFSQEEFIFNKSNFRLIRANEYDINFNIKKLSSYSKYYYDDENRLIKIVNISNDFLAKILKEDIYITTFNYLYNDYLIIEIRSGADDKEGNSFLERKYYNNKNQLVKYEYYILGYENNNEKMTLDDEAIFNYNDNGDLISYNRIYKRSNDDTIQKIVESMFNIPTSYEQSEYIYKYNSNGQKISVTLKNNLNNSNFEGYKYYYDNKNNLIKIENYWSSGLKIFTEIKYNALNQKISEIKYSYKSYYTKDKKHIIDYKIKPNVVYYRSYEYDNNNNLIKIHNHNHMDFENIEDMNIFETTEFIYEKIK